MTGRGSQWCRRLSSKAASAEKRPKRVYARGATGVVQFNNVVRRWIASHWWGHPRYTTIAGWALKGSRLGANMKTPCSNRMRNCVRVGAPCWGPVRLTTQSTTVTVTCHSYLSQSQSHVTMWTLTVLGEVHTECCRTFIRRAAVLLDVYATASGGLAMCSGAARERLAGCSGGYVVIERGQRPVTHRSCAASARALVSPAILKGAPAA